SSGQETMRILRDFDERLLEQALDPDLADEDERLEKLNATTKLIDHIHYKSNAEHTRNPEKKKQTLM
ncbi:hypothetical protein FRC06_010366, partial [Ceratobasidium sp. 370]